MKALQKLRMVWKTSILLLLTTLIFIVFKENIKQGIILGGLIVILAILTPLIYQKKKQQNKEANLPVYSLFGTIFIIIAALFSIGSVVDLINGNSLPLEGIIATLLLWLFGILIAHYVNKIKK